MEKKNNIIQRFTHAFYDFSYYKTFLKESVGKALWMIVLLTFIFSLASSAITVASLGTSIEDAMREAITEMPYFKLADGTLSSKDETFRVFGQDEDFIVFDLEGKMTAIDFMKEYKNGIYLNKDSATVVNRGEIRSINFSDIKDIHFDRNDMENFIGPVLIVVKVVIMMLPFFVVIGKMINLVFIGLICTVVGLFLRRRSSFGEAFRIGIYANVVPTVILGLLSLFPVVKIFLSPVLGFVYYGVTILYTYFIYQQMKKDPPVNDEVITENEEIIE